MTTPGYERELGGIQERLKAMEETQGEMQTDIKAIRDVVVSVKGGWKTISIIVAVSGALGALVSNISAIWTFLYHH